MKNAPACANISPQWSKGKIIALQHIEAKFNALQARALECRFKRSTPLPCTRVALVCTQHAHIGMHVHTLYLAHTVRHELQLRWAASATALLTSDSMTNGYTRSSLRRGGIKQARTAGCQVFNFWFGNGIKGTQLQLV